MTTKHTPGPWMNDPLQPTIWANDGDLKVATIADLPNTPRGSDWMTEQANARLIASAPDMLKALESFVHNYRTSEDMVSSFQMAKEAIAKAKGE